MTHETYLAAVPFELNIAMLADLLSTTFASDAPPDGFGITELGNLCNTIGQKFATNGSLDPRITTAINANCVAFYTTLRNSLIALNDTITDDRDAL